MDNATIKDVARLSGYSISTVSRVINGTGHVRPEAEKRIREAISKTQYVPNSSASNLKRQSSRNIALLMNSYPGTKYRDFYSVFSKKIGELGYKLSLHIIESESEFDEIRKEKRLCGAVSIGFRLQKDTDLPYISCLSDSADSGIDYSFELSRAVGRLRESGYKNIALLGSALFEASRVYKSLDFGDSSGLYMETDRHLPSDSFENGYVSTLRLLSQNDGVDALIVSDDELALGAFKAIRESGRSVPDDIGLITFGYSDMGRFLPVSITTMRIPVERIANCAAEMIDNLIKEGKNEGKSLYPCEFIVGESIK